jgi:hypothetical protein
MVSGAGLDGCCRRPIVSIPRRMTLRRTLAPAATAVAALALAPAALAVPGGAYKGKIAYQGYDVTFKVKGNKVTDVVARMLADCDRDGYTETFLIAPESSWTIKRGRVSGKKVEAAGQSKAHVVLEGRFSGRTFKGSIREWDTVEGSGVVCDTLVRKFTAKRR